MKKTKRSGSEARRTNVNIKTSVSEKASIDKAAEEAGKSTSTYLLDIYYNYGRLLRDITSLKAKLVRYENSRNNNFLERHKDRELVFPVETGFIRIIPKEKSDVFEIFRDGYDSYCFIINALKKDHPEILKKIINDCAKKEQEIKKASENSHPPSK